VVSKPRPQSTPSIPQSISGGGVIGTRFANLKRSSLFSAELIRSIGRNSSSIVELATPGLPRALSRADSVTIYNESSSHFEGTRSRDTQRERERETWSSLQPRLRPPPVSFLPSRTPLKGRQEFHVSSRLKDTRNTVSPAYIKNYPSRRISERRHLEDSFIPQ